MIAAYADGYRVLKVEKYRQAAEKAAGFLLDKLRSPDGRLLRTYRQGKAKLPAYLEDYAFLAHGLLRLHAATGDARWLREARTLTDRMIADFEDREEGGFFFTADGHESLLARAKDPFDNALPSGNSMAILDLLALYRATGESSYRDHAGKALDAFSTSLLAGPGRDAAGRWSAWSNTSIQARPDRPQAAGARRARRRPGAGCDGHGAPGRRDAGRDRARRRVRRGRHASRSRTAGTSTPIPTGRPGDEAHDPRPRRRVSERSATPGQGHVSRRARPRSLGRSAPRRSRSTKGKSRSPPGSGSRTTPSPARSTEASAELSGLQRPPLPGPGQAGDPPDRDGRTLKNRRTRGNR